MTDYGYSYRGLDRGRESSWDKDFWLGTLRILAAHSGEDLHDMNSPVYHELSREFPDEAWQGDEENRSFFRDYPNAWTHTGILLPLTETGGSIEITELGRAVLRGTITRKEVFLKAMMAHEEQAEGFVINPFQVIATAFAESDRPLELGDVYNVMKHFLPGLDPLAPVLARSATRSADIPDTSRRRLRHILKLMVVVGALTRIGSTWLAGDRAVLAALANTSPPRPNGRPAQTAASRARQGENARLLAGADTDLAAQGEFDISNLADGRQRTMAAIVRRQGQGAFRRNVLRVYEGTCAVSGYKVSEAIDAAHLIEYLGPETNHVKNGLPLRCDIHNLWDLGLIAVDTATMTIVVSERLSETPYADLHGKTLRTPADFQHGPSIEALDRHRQNSGI